MCNRKLISAIKWEKCFYWRAPKIYLSVMMELLNYKKFRVFMIKNAPWSIRSDNIGKETISCSRNIYLRDITRYFLIRTYFWPSTETILALSWFQYQNFRKTVFAKIFEFWYIADVPWNELKSNVKSCMDKCKHYNWSQKHKVNCMKKRL